MDIIKAFGRITANFLDVGGAPVLRLLKQFPYILKDPAVKAILINIFGGIVRCRQGGKCVVEAYKSIGKLEFL